MSDSKQFAGHLGNLTKTQEQALTTFKERLAQDNLYSPPSDTYLASHDDATLLRFLRARKFDIAKAHKQLAGAAAWREKHDVDRLFANFDTDEMEKARSFYPMWTGRRDKVQCFFLLWPWIVGMACHDCKDDMRYISPVE
jgi:hypothetical protein